MFRVSADGTPLVANRRECPKWASVCTNPRARCTSSEAATRTAAPSPASKGKPLSPGLQTSATTEPKGAARSAVTELELTINLKPAESSSMAVVPHDTATRAATLRKAMLRCAKPLAPAAVKRGIVANGKTSSRAASTTRQWVGLEPQSCSSDASSTRPLSSDKTRATCQPCASSQGSAGLESFSTPHFNARVL
jgi:hypothetical protein